MDGTSARQQLSAQESTEPLATPGALEQLRVENEELRGLEERLASVEKAAGEGATRNAQLEGAAQMRSHLHSNIAHELRTPLTAVRGYARLMIDGRSGEINERQREYLNAVVENANRMIRLITWMTEVFDDSEADLRLSVFDLRDIWSQCVGDYESRLTERAIQLTQDIPDEPFIGFADRDRMADIFRNVLGGAIHFSDPGARLVVRFSRGRERETTMKFFGISREIPAGLAMEERNSHQTASPDGIDFSSVRNNVGMQGGRFYILRNPEEGSVLLVTLPAIRSEGHQGSIHT